MSINGKPKPEEKSPLTIEEMQAETKRLRVANRLKEAQIHKNILESAYSPSDYGWPWGGSDSAEQFVRLRDQSDGLWNPISLPSDRKGGAKWPLWRSDMDLNRIRQASRMCCAANSYAQGLLRNLTNYVIGVGLNYKCGPKNKNLPESNHDQDEATNELKAKENTIKRKSVDTFVQSTQEWIDEFCGRCNINGSAPPVDEDENGAVSSASSTVEREAYWREKRDGDAMLRLFRRINGRVDVRFVGPEMIWGAPPGEGQAQGWWFGIKHVMTDDGHLDLGKVLAYYVRPRDVSSGHSMTDLERDSLGGEIVPAVEMLHIKDAWEDAEVSRGTPLFSFDLLDALNRAAKLTRNMSISSAVRAARAEVWMHRVGTANTIGALQQGPGSRQVTDFMGQSRTEAQRYPGEIARIPYGQEPVPYSTTTNIPDHQMAQQGDLRQACAGICAPEYFAGSTNDANYATASEAGTPFVRNGESEQTHYKGAFLRLMWRVVRWAVQCGKLPQEVLTLVNIEVGTMEIKKNNEGELAQARKANLESKVTSPQIECAKVGNDPKQVETDWLEWDKKGMTKLGQPEPGEEGAQGAGMPNKPKPPQLPGAVRKPLGQVRESLESEDAQWIEIPAGVLSLLESKDASGHEHKEKGEGGGQFTSSGGDGGQSEPARTGNKPANTKMDAAHIIQQSQTKEGRAAITEALKDKLDEFTSMEYHLWDNEDEISNKIDAVHLAIGTLRRGANLGQKLTDDEYVALHAKVEAAIAEIGKANLAGKKAWDEEYE